jgi:hypothetical protein
MLLSVVKVLPAVLADQCRATRVEGGHLSGHAAPGVGGAGRQIDRRTGGQRQAVIGPGPPLRSWLRAREVPVGLRGT